MTPERIRIMACGLAPAVPRIHSLLQPAWPSPAASSAGKQQARKGMARGCVPANALDQGAGRWLQMPPELVLEPQAQRPPRWSYKGHFGLICLEMLPHPELVCLQHSISPHLLALCAAKWGPDRIRNHRDVGENARPGNLLWISTLEPAFQPSRSGTHTQNPCFPEHSSLVF